MSVDQINLEAQRLRGLARELRERSREAAHECRQAWESIIRARAEYSRLTGRVVEREPLERQA